MKISTKSLNLMLGLISIYLFIYASTSFAQRGEAVKNRIINLADAVITEVEFTDASRSELREVRKKLKDALKILEGNSSGSSIISYKCVSRDSDGMSPYALAVENEDLVITKLGNVIFKNIGNCEAAISNMISDSKGEASFVCASKDRDGMTPTTVYTMRGENGAIDLGLVFKSEAICAKSLSQVRETKTAIAFCSSADKDGMSPWSTYVYNKRANTIDRNSERYSSLSDCISNM